MTRRAIDERAFAALCTLIALLCLGGLYRAITVLFLHVPLDPNEGWNAYHAADAIAGRALYPGSSPFFFNNYPPLSFYFVGALGAVVGDNIFAGRIVSLIALLLSAVAIAWLSRRMGTELLAALFGALLFAAVLLLESDYVGMDDPQLLGHAVELGALFLVLFEPRTASKLALAALLFVAALFIKHNLFVLPLAAWLWLTSEDRKSAMIFAGLGIVFVIVGAIAFRLAYGHSILAELGSARAWSWTNFREGLAGALVWMAVPLVLLAALLGFEGRDRYARFAAIYAGLAVPIGVILLSGSGVDANALFDAAIALSLASALEIGKLHQSGRPLAFLAAFLIAVPLAYVLYASVDADWYAASFWTKPWVDEARTGEADIAFLKMRPGYAVCETLALCYWAGKKETVDVFNLNQAYAAGARSAQPLIADINRRRFAILEFESSAPFPPEVKQAIDRSYALERSSDDGRFLMPR